MRAERLKRIGKIIVKSIFALLIMGVIGMPFFTGGLKDPGNPLSHKKVTGFDSYVRKVFMQESEPSEKIFTLDDLLSNIENFVRTPDGGTKWDMFGRTIQIPYSYHDKDGIEWSGVRPDFPDELKQLDGIEIIIQGFMFPLDPTEKQKLFLLGPFPVSCPYHYHVTPNLILEVHARHPVFFTYDAVNVKGTLELVPKDDEYNVFFRLKNAELLE